VLPFFQTADRQKLAVRSAAHFAKQWSYLHELLLAGLTGARHADKTLLKKHYATPAPGVSHNLRQSTHIRQLSRRRRASPHVQGNGEARDLERTDEFFCLTALRL